MINRRSFLIAGAASLAGAAQGHAVAKHATGPNPARSVPGMAQGSDYVHLEPEMGMLHAQVAPDMGGILAGLQYKVGGEFAELLYRGRNFAPTKSWGGKAPVLWPAVGLNTVDPEESLDKAAGWMWKGRHYPMPMHGFVRSERWRVEKVFSGRKTAYGIVSTVDSPATRAMYPFGFRLGIEYRVAESKIVLSHCVSAASANSGPMPFSIGNHATFNLPFLFSSNANQITITSSAKRHILLGKNKIPTGQVVDVDYSKPRLLSSLGVQTPVSLGGCPPGNVWTRLEDPSGMAITVSHQCDWRPRGEPVLFNLWGDVPHGFFAPEPWIGKQDSLASGDGLIHLPPGEEFHWRVSIDISLFEPLTHS